MPLRIVLAYSDFPDETLVKNLNLVLTSPTGEKFAGNQEAGGPANLDSLNDEEMIELGNPAAGA